MALDITLDAAEVAIVASGQSPTETDWVAADWVRTAPTQTITTSNRLTTDYWFAKITATVDNVSDTAWLRILVGATGTIALPDGAKVDFWSRVHDNPEVPVQKHGSVSIS